MKKNFLKSLSLGVASLSLIASCSMIKGSCKENCEKNKCASEKADEANKCATSKKEEINNCASNNNCAAAKEEVKKEVKKSTVSKTKKAKK